MKESKKCSLAPKLPGPGHLLLQLVCDNTNVMSFFLVQPPTLVLQAAIYVHLHCTAHSQSESRIFSNELLNYLEFVLDETRATQALSLSFLVAKEKTV